ncbi:MAG: choline/carnitine O-acyltransferase [bacterium]|nr:choline/carnitine O-acyltransferase [bacterium]
MNHQERTRDVYEEVGGYQKPPIIPLQGIENLELHGLKSCRFSHIILKTAIVTTGFRRFYQQLPQRFEDIYRKTNLRLPGLYTPLISATLTLADDPRKVSPIERAATLIFATRNLYNDIVSGKLPQDMNQDQVLEMGQYPNLFSTCLIVDGKEARIFKSTNTTSIIVIVARRFYKLEIGIPGIETTIDQVKEALSDIVRRAQQNRLRNDEPSPGVLTCASNSRQIRTFYKLQKIKTNADSLAALRHSFITLCLDLESFPESYADAAYFTHSSNCENRWFHSSLQLVVFGNARASVICNFTTYLDGNTMMRAASEIQKRGIRCPLTNNANSTRPNIPTADELKWMIRPGTILQARQDINRILDTQQATFEIQSIGRNFFKTHNIAAVPAFILALQMTAKRFTGKNVKISQFLSMSKYRCMDLVTTVVTTPEVIKFVELMDGSELNNCHAMQFMQQAINSQAQACRMARRYNSLDDILPLFYHLNRGVKRLYIIFIAILTNFVLKIFGLLKSEEREILVSHPEIYREVPVVGRPGIRLPYVKYFGLHYQIYEQKIVITMMPSVNWRIPNAELIAVLTESLDRIKQVIIDANWGGNMERSLGKLNEKEILDTTERARDIYEHIAAYPKPPIIPLPDEADIRDFIEELGQNSGKLLRWMMQTSMAVTGFRNFLKRLPDSLENILCRSDLRGGGLFSHVISASLALADDTRNLSPVKRAATLLFAARSLYLDVMSGNLPPDRYKDQILEMGQYPNLFSTSLIVEGNRARIFKSRNASCITVIVRGKFYILHIGNPDVELGFEQIEAALNQIIQDAQQSKHETNAISPGILTCANHGTQLRIFQKMQQSEINKESLHALRHSFVTLCLDLDQAPANYSEVALASHVGNNENRWYHSSLQIVVFGNSKACTICNFSTYLDGNPMMRAASELQKRANAWPVDKKTGKNFASLPPPDKLQWDIDQRFIQLAERDFKLIQDNQPATFEILGVGKKQLAVHNLQPIPVFIVALQMAALQLFEKMVRITQFMTMSRFRCMDLVTPNVTTPAMIRFAEYLTGADVQKTTALKLLQEAIVSQLEEMRKARKKLPIPDALHLQMLAAKGWRRSFIAIVFSLRMILFNIMGASKRLGREILVSHPEIYPEVPVVGRPGIRLPYVKYMGLHYQIMEEKIVITYMPALKCTISNQEFTNALEQELKKIIAIIQGD